LLVLDLAPEPCQITVILYSLVLKMKFSHLFLVAMILFCAPYVIFGKVDKWKAKAKEAAFNLKAAAGGLITATETIPKSEMEKFQSSGSSSPVVSA